MPGYPIEEVGGGQKEHEKDPEKGRTPISGRVYQSKCLYARVEGYFGGSRGYFEGYMDWIDQARKQRELQFEGKYGPIHPRDNGRCFRKEMLEELLDALNYAEWSRKKGEINRYKWKRINSGIRVVIHLIEIACDDSFWWKLEAQKF